MKKQQQQQHKTLQGGRVKMHFNPTYETKETMKQFEEKNLLGGRRWEEGSQCN